MARLARNSSHLVHLVVVVFTQAVGDIEWNVAKIGGASVSFPLYESFDASAFPALLREAKVAVPNTAVTDYS